MMQLRTVDHPHTIIQYFDEYGHQTTHDRVGKNIFLTFSYVYL